ncbi:MAG: hypothetical protein Q9171_006600 [Xanthocarpia ochracea]
MLLLALTGSLATGKSTVSNLLSQSPYCLPVIDADVLARAVVEPGTPGYKKIVNNFASTTPDLLLPRPVNERDENGSKAGHEKVSHKPGSSDDRTGRPLNRAALGRRVFGSTPSRQRDRKILNSIVHPAVRWAMARSVLYYYIRGHWAVVLDIPLLYDSYLDIFAPVVLMVAASPEVQMSRLRLRDPHLSEEEARDRVASQGGVDVKVARTEARGKGRGYVIWNDGSREQLEEKVGVVIREVQRGRKGLWRWVMLVLWPLAVVWAGWEVGRGWWSRLRWEAEAKEKVQ